MHLILKLMTTYTKIVATDMHCDYNKKILAKLDIKISLECAIIYTK